eukprot:2419721-Rhodomonas_salina.4
MTQRTFRFARFQTLIVVSDDPEMTVGSIRRVSTGQRVAGTEDSSGKEERDAPGQCRTQRSTRVGQQGSAPVFPEGPKTAALTALLCPVSWCCALCEHRTPHIMHEGS